MDRTDLVAEIRSFVADLPRPSRGEDWSTVRHLLGMDEVEEAMDVLIATLVRDNVPISPAQQDTVRRLTTAFDLSAHDRSLYGYLGDSEMLDRMTVVDEPSS